ncbi:hypothetical protein L6452_16055 [Arctium lappa]|uniref:Uncharacterized protein n=1 Tax=Arctium lappa TaxID=4217 RepID=A0ACB9BZF9_ARCLA|nr:hypothetical protein L6452_16055 [Arctium lappa]
MDLDSPGDAPDHDAATHGYALEDFVEGSSSSCERKDKPRRKKETPLPQTPPNTHRPEKDQHRDRDGQTAREGTAAKPLHSPQRRPSTDTNATPYGLHPTNLLTAVEQQLRQP